MPRFTISMTVLVSVDVEAETLSAAKATAQVLLESMEPSSDFVGGWNDVARSQGTSTLGEVRVDLEGIEGDPLDG